MCTLFLPDNKAYMHRNGSFEYNEIIISFYIWIFQSNKNVHSSAWKKRNDKMVKTMIVEDIKLKLGTFLHVYSHKMCWSMCVCWHSVLQIAKMLCIPTTTTIICDMTTINVLVFRTRYEHFCQRLHMFIHLPVCYLVHSLVQPFRLSLSHWKSISIHVSKRVHTFN